VVTSTAAPDGTPYPAGASDPVPIEMTSMSDPKSSRTEVAATSDSAASSSTVASLLSQLQPPSTFSSIDCLRHTVQSGLATRLAHVAPADGVKGTATEPLNSKQLSTPDPPKADLRDYTFQQALPVLASLADSPDLVAALNLVVNSLFRHRSSATHARIEMKMDQHTLERRLFEERSRLLKEQEKRLEVALTKWVTFPRHSFTT
jgi:hypothetical protein